MQRLIFASSNEAFATDFGSSATLPSCPRQCDCYEDHLDDFHGLGTYANEFWRDCMSSLVARLRAFTAGNKSAGSSPPARIQLKLHFVDLLGRAVTYLQSDSPQ